MARRRRTEGGRTKKREGEGETDMHILGLALVLSMGVGQQTYVIQQRQTCHVISKNDVGYSISCDTPIRWKSQPAGRPGWVTHGKLQVAYGPPCSSGRWECMNGEGDPQDLQEPAAWIEVPLEKTGELQVVPAVQESYLAHKKGDSCTTPGMAMDCLYMSNSYEMRWTCADKSMAILESVDGQKHWCVRFP